MRGLLVLRCGTSSLHPDWLGEQRKNWDLILCPYQQMDSHGLEAHFIPGQKWDGLAKFFGQSQAWCDYDYICLPDDDIATNAPTLNAFFDFCDQFKISLAAPALTQNSYFSHPITIQNTEFVARRTSFVEIMMPCFSRAFFKEVLPTLGLSQSGTGFGLDFLWPYMLSYENVWLIDDSPVHHTRPVGAMRKGGLADLANGELQFIRGFGIPAVTKTIGGLTRDRGFRRAEEAEFGELYRRGYGKLANRDPGWSAYIDQELATVLPAVNASSRERVHFALQHLSSPDHTVSRGKPSRTSSTSQWSWSADPALDARGANDGRLNGSCGFHTSYELNPWWQVDLAGPHAITSVVIYNRLDQPLRCVDFDILVSDDAQSWVAAYQKRDGVPFGGVDGHPFRHDFDPPIGGRFLRVQLTGANFLHLDQVEVFGSPGAGVRPAATAIPMAKSPLIVSELLTQLYGGASPFAYCDLNQRDDGYPHTNLIPEVIDSVLELLQPKFWLEIGTMLGGSAIRTAELIKRRGLDTGLICIDPFCGDVNMWAWEQPKRRAGEWLFLGLRNGRPSIFERFIANAVAAGHSDIMLPITATSIVGTKLLARLRSEGRIGSLPSVIYLDSAHEPDETLLELRNCWELLPAGGVLMGDDWSWSAVRNDVLRFAKSVPLNEQLARALEQRHGGFSRYEGVLLDRGQWLLLK
jgi:F5/8 type C domain/Methyltransferase domain